MLLLVLEIYFSTEFAYKSFFVLEQLRGEQRYMQMGKNVKNIKLNLIIANILILKCPHFIKLEC